MELCANPSMGSSVLLDFHLQIAEFDFYPWIGSAHIYDFSAHHRLTCGISSVGLAAGTWETGITLSLPKPEREAPRAIVTKEEKLDVNK